MRGVEINAPLVRIDARQRPFLAVFALLLTMVLGAIWLIGLGTIWFALLHGGSICG